MIFRMILFPALVCLACSYGLGFGDVVELKNGERIEGLILSENEDSIEIQVRQNETGTIRYVMIIHASEIHSWVADQAGRISREKGSDVKRLGGTEYVERLLLEAEKKIDEGNYTQGITQFGEAADLAVQDVDKLEPADRVEALKIRAHALRLQLAALEGKSEFIEKKTDGVLEEMEDREKQLKKDIEEYKKDKEDYEEEHKNQAIQLGERHKKTDLMKREEELLQRQMKFNEQKGKVEQAMDEYEKDLIKTRTQIKLVEERVEQSEDDAKAAERELRRR